MKLIDLLVKELPKRGGWPEGVAAMAQDADGAVQNYSSTEYITIDAEHAAGISRISCSYSILPSKVAVASDRLTAIVTRAQYEAALAKNDGWIKVMPGEYPVNISTVIDVKFDDGSIIYGMAIKGSKWHGATHYRLHCDINSRANDDRLEQDLNECIGQDVALAWDGEGLPPVGAECEALYDTHRNEWVKSRIIAHDSGGVIGRWLDGDKCNELFDYSMPDGSFRPLRTESEKAREKAIQELSAVICGNIPDTGMATATMYATRIYDAGYRKEKK